jgi:hypothetical protein
MAYPTLSVPNIVIQLSVPQLVSLTTLTGFAPDDIYTIETVDNVELVMGLDGILSAGWMPAPRTIIFKQMANSPTASFFTQWDQGQQLARDVYPAQGIITYPGLGYQVNLVQGFLGAQHFLPDAAKILQPQTFRISWQNVLHS